MKQYDAPSLPNPQIKHAKNVEFPLNDKDSYFNLKILRQKEILIACCLFVHILVFLQLCFIILKICANMTYYSGISKYASDENVRGHFPLIKSLHIFWYLAMTVELTGTVEKKTSCFTTTLTYCILNACSSVQNCQSWSLLLLCSVVASIVVVEEEKEALYGRQHSSY